MGQGKKKCAYKELPNLEGKFVLDKTNGVALSISMLVKSYAAGELIWKENLKKKLKRNRSKIKPEVRGYIKILFLDTYVGMQKPTINGAIERMINRTASGHYIFKEISQKIPSVSSEKTSQKKFLEKQVAFIWGTKPKLDAWIKENWNENE
jgi:hypothetical protein